MKKILLYGSLLGLLLVVLQFSAYRFVVLDHATEIYGGIVALIFTILGIWMGLKLTKTNKEVVIVERAMPKEFILNEPELEKRGISRRELEVLRGMSEGLSNQEIADKLFISLNTIKSHSANLFTKLDVRRRTQAIQKGKDLNLLP